MLLPFFVPIFAPGAGRQSVLPAFFLFSGVAFLNPAEPGAAASVSLFDITSQTLKFPIDRLSYGIHNVF